MVRDVSGSMSGGVCQVGLIVETVTKLCPGKGCIIGLFVEWCCRTQHSTFETVDIRVVLKVKTS